jgi:hypothetical protein
MSDALKTLNEVLEQLKLGAPFEAGVLQTTTELITDHAVALEKFNAFQGPGWLLTAAEKDVLILPADAAKITGQWPVCGERISAENSQQSMHLRHDGRQWLLTTVTRTAGAELIAKAQLLGKDEKPLYYEVGYRLTKLENQAKALAHEEWRPAVYRFLGFVKPQKG